MVNKKHGMTSVSDNILGNNKLVTIRKKNVYKKKLIDTKKIKPINKDGTK